MAIAAITMPAIAPPLSEDECDDFSEGTEAVVEGVDAVCAEPVTVERRLDSEIGAVVGIGLITVMELTTA